MKTELTNEELAGVLILGSILAIVAGFLGLGFGLIFFSFLQAIGISIVLAVIVFLTSVRVSARKLLKSKA